MLLALLVLAGIVHSAAWSGVERNPFPSIAGWTLTVDTIVYTPDNLWNIIDGAADAYLLYGFADLCTGEYLTPDSVDVRAELYRHSSAANAFGIYSQERKPEYRFIDMGTEGYTEDGVLNFLCGIYYVKLTSHTMGLAGLAALRTTAERLVSFLDQPIGFPPQLSLLPSEGKIKRSESFIADSYLGYSFFRSAYVAQYDSGGRTQLFVMEYDSPANAQASFVKYAETLGKKSKQFADGTYTLTDPNNGTIGMILKGQYLCGVVNCENEKGRAGHLTSLEKTISTDPRGKSQRD